MSAESARQFFEESIMRKETSESPERKKEVFSDGNIFSKQEKELMVFGADHFLDQLVEQDFDAMVFLDQSARLWAHLLRARWQYRFPEKQFPQVKFLKVGRETAADILRIKKEEGGQQRNVYRQLRETFQTLPPKILVVDSFMYSGGSVEKATDMLQRAFPKSVIKKSAVFLGFKGDEKRWPLDDFAVKPLRIKTYDEPKTVHPAAIGSDPNSLFIQTWPKEIQRMIDVANPEWKRKMRRLLKMKEIKVSSDLQKEIESIKQFVHKEQELYKLGIKEVKEIAQVETNSSKEPYLMRAWKEMG